MSTPESLTEDARQESIAKDREYYLRCEEEADRLSRELRAARAVNGANDIIIDDLTRLAQLRLETVTTLSAALKQARDERDDALERLGAIREVLDQ